MAVEASKKLGLVRRWERGRVEGMVCLSLLFLLNLSGLAGRDSQPSLICVSLEERPAGAEANGLGRRNRMCITTAAYFRRHNRMCITTATGAVIGYCRRSRMCITTAC